MSKCATDSPDVWAGFDRTTKKWIFGFDCVGLCKFALCETMPPSDDDACCFNREGCKNTDAQNARLKSLKRAIDEKIKGEADE